MHTLIIRIASTVHTAQLTVSNVISCQFRSLSMCSSVRMKQCVSLQYSHSDSPSKFCVNAFTASFLANRYLRKIHCFV